MATGVQGLVCGHRSPGASLWPQESWGYFVVTGVMGLLCGHGRRGARLWPPKSRGYFGATGVQGLVCGCSCRLAVPGRESKG